MMEPEPVASLQPGLDVSKNMEAPMVWLSGHVNVIRLSGLPIAVNMPLMYIELYDAKLTVTPGSIVKVALG